MGLTLYSAPAIEPVDLDDARQFARIDQADQDALVVSALAVARSYVEQATRRALISQTWDLKLDGFDDPEWVRNGVIILPKPPLSSVTSITYVDTAGTTQTWSATEYQVVTYAGDFAQPGRIAEAYGYTYPSTRTQANSVTIRFVAGYGTDADDVPAGLKHAIKLLVMELLERGAPSGVVVPIAELQIRRLLAPYKVFL